MSENETEKILKVNKPESSEETGNDLIKADIAFDYLNIKLVTTKEECDQVIHDLKSDCSTHGAIGFDCEWVQYGHKRHPIALIQLSSQSGLCGLFQLNKLKTIPQSLKELLEDENIYKTGVMPQRDAKLIQSDYSVAVKSTLDIRFIAELCKYKPLGLENLTKSVLKIDIEKDRKVAGSNWDKQNLSEKQIKYAALDAHVAIKIFIQLINEHDPSIWSNLSQFCNEYVNRIFEHIVIGLQIDGIPENESEDLDEILKKILEVISFPIEGLVYSCERIGKPRERARPRGVEVNLTDVAVRDKILESVKNYNKSNADSKLSTKHLGFSDDPSGIYVSELLLPHIHRLFLDTRRIAKEKGYQQVWVQDGHIFIKKRNTVIEIKHSKMLKRL